MEEKEINCLYGSEQRKSVLFVCGSWYCCEGSVNCNKCSDPSLLVEGVDIEMLEDIDVFTWNEQINSLSEFVKAVNN